MSKPETLRGRGRFREVGLRGRKIYTDSLRASYLDREHDSGTIRVGIAVPRASGKAVERNRIKRLVREALRERIPDLRSDLDARQESVDLLLTFRGGKGVPINRISLKQIAGDVRTIFRTLASHLEKRSG